MPYKSTLEDSEKLSELKLGLPIFVRNYFDSRQMRLSLKTMISCAYDFQLFFRYLKENNPAFSEKPIVNFSIEDLGKLSVEDMEEFMSWQRRTCESNTTINRRLSSVSSLYDYLIKRDYLLMKNPVSLIDREKRV
ncbi:MAG: site-specific integrase, partial [Lachnospiraceae bacterium]|nr:site-specific integrase [Lachnospiraceae bacterium]